MISISIDPLFTILCPVRENMVYGYRCKLLDTKTRSKTALIVVVIKFKSSNQLLPFESDAILYSINRMRRQDFLPLENDP